MCRIAGLVNPRLTAPELLQLVKAMCQSLQHGGPDDEGFFQNTEQHFVLGNRRLSIIDLSGAGHQPMFYASEEYAITYNGELYNYPLLKKELIALGYTFTTNTDTEVVLASYAAWGEAAFSRYQGMFAFALWHKAQNHLLLVRDAAGIKPLYYAHTTQGLAFASEVRALKHIPYLNQANANWPVYLMAYGHIPEPITTLQQVQPLAKGHVLRYNPATNASTISCYKKYTFTEEVHNRNAAVAVVKEKLNHAVQRHLVSNAPLGIFLSGGLDSSIIAQLAAQRLPSVNTLSLHFSEKNYSEKKFQDILARKLTAQHHQHLLTGDEFHAYLTDIMADMDMPCGDGINTWFISKYARAAGLKAVLSGIGSDELFGGYPSFHRIHKVLALQRIPNLLLKAGRFSGSKRLRRMAYLSIPGNTGRYLFLRGYFIPADIARCLGATESDVWEILESNASTEDTSHLSHQNIAAWMETNMYMQNQLLRDADVMSMAHGVEIRVPFLDDELMQYVMQIATSVKFTGGQPKQLLIDAFADTLPREIWDRPKMGFAFPFREWLTHDRYADAGTGKILKKYHSRLKEGSLHWSQYFTLLLLNNFHNAL
jgi:asparagine synthase (glutamine-hydrolysing)